MTLFLVGITVTSYIVVGCFLGLMDAYMHYEGLAGIEKPNNLFRWAVYPPIFVGRMIGLIIFRPFDGKDRES